MPPPSEIKCEVCETVQPPATLCANCGVPLHLPKGMVPVADAPIERVPDFESTVIARVGPVGGERIPELEETVQPRVKEVPPEFVPGFEATEILLLDLPGPDEVVPDLERTVEAFEKAPARPAGGPAPCQYCGFVQATGRICNNCGLARSKVAPLAPSGGRRETPRVRCSGCGSIVLMSALCSDCGNPLPPVET